MPRKQNSSSIVKDNWYLIVAVVVLLVGGAIAAFWPSGAEEPAPTGVIGTAGEGVNIVRLAEDEAVSEDSNIRYQDLSADERDQKYIEDYQEQLQNNPDPEKAAGLLMSLSVVYRRQHQYDDAAIALEDILEKYPDSPHSRTAAILLPEVYQDAGDVSMARASYQRMMDRFPPESPEHQWAQKRYGEI